MIYIDLYCSRDKLEAWKKWYKENKDDDDDEPECRTGYWERGPQVMSYYFRLLCIAAYRRISRSKEEEYAGSKKDDILNSLLDICPPDARSLDPSRRDKAQKHCDKMMAMQLKLMCGGQGQDFSDLECAPLVDMAGIEDNMRVRRHLSAIGLGPMIQWVSNRCQTSDTITDDIILPCAKMFTDYLEDVPDKEADLEGTPYSKSERIEDNLDGNGCVEYKETLEPAFRNTAQFGKGCYGKHC